MATLREINKFIQLSENFIRKRPPMAANNKDGRVFKSAAEELDELTKAFANAGWDPEHPEEFDIYEHPEIIEEFADPILYILQVFHGTDIPVAYYLKDLLETKVSYADAEILVARAKEEATDPDSAKFNEISAAYRVIGSSLLFCLAHGVDPIRVSVMKNMYNEIRFELEDLVGEMSFAEWIALCKKIERDLELKKFFYLYLTQKNIGLVRPGQQTVVEPLEPVLIMMRSHLQSVRRTALIAA